MWGKAAKRLPDRGHRAKSASLVRKEAEAEAGSIRTEIRNGPAQDGPGRKAPCRVARQSGERRCGGRLSSSWTRIAIRPCSGRAAWNRMRLIMTAARAAKNAKIISELHRDILKVGLHAVRWKTQGIFDPRPSPLPPLSPASRTGAFGDCSRLALSRREAARYGEA